MTVTKLSALKEHQIDENYQSVKDHKIGKIYQMVGPLLNGISSNKLNYKLKRKSVSICGK